MRNRVHLGATYYYLWSIPFFFSAHPLSAYGFAALLGVFAVALTFLVGRRLGGDWTGVGAAALLATSPIAVLDSRVAWAPAAIPILVAGFLWASAAFLEAPSRARAAWVGGLGALATQCHLATAPLLVVAVCVILARRRALGSRGLIVPGVALALPLLPMLWAWFEPVQARPVAGSDLASPYAHRLGDMLLFGARSLDGLSPPSGDRPWLVDAWLGVERGWLMIVLLALGWAALVRPGSHASGGLRAVVAIVLAVGLAAVALLPAEAWYYYLDTTLVPAALLVGWALARGPLGSAGGWLLAGLVVARSALVLWWVVAAHHSGFVSVNLDLLRLGGPRAEHPQGRARVLGVATRERAAEVLVGRLGIGAPRLWRDVHGPGFSDLDNDNGYFLHRASRIRGTWPDGAPGALVVHRGGYPDAWLDALPAPISVGPLDIVAYQPSLRLDSARLVNCGGGALPSRSVPQPLEYGSGEFPRPAWPCEDPVVRIEVDAPADGAKMLRVFARVDGPGRVVSIDAEPGGTAIDPTELGLGASAGMGIRLSRFPSVLQIRLALDGPAALDVYELRGH